MRNWIIRFNIQNRFSQPRRRQPGGVGSLLRNSALIMFLCPFQDLIEVAAFVHVVEIRMRAVMRKHPVGRDGCHVAGTHYDLTEVVYAVI